VACGYRYREEVLGSGLARKSEPGFRIEDAKLFEGRVLVGNI
jgi:hypothetical protein